MTDRPLWRIGTKTLAQELRRRGEGESVQRAFLSECDLTLLLAEVVARGYGVTPPMVKLGGGEDGVPEGQEISRIEVEAGGPVRVTYRPTPSALLGKRWPPLGDDDVPFDGEAERRLPFTGGGDE